jgi:raffinose/stachyose/melibiose transport system permease protein
MGGNNGYDSCRKPEEVILTKNYRPSVRRPVIFLLKAFMKRKNWDVLIFSGPALIVYISVVIVPVIWSMGYSFFDWNGIAKMRFAGINNYVRMFNDVIFKAAFMNNLYFMALGTAYQILSGLIMATILSSISKGSNIMRVLYFMPCIISSAAICKVFDKLLSVEPLGIFAALAVNIGLTPIAILSDPKWALATVTIVDGYKFCGIYMVIFYSAFMSLPGDVEEAAYIDGCSWFQQYFHIKLPMIRNMFIVVVVMLVNGTLKGFDVAYILTYGGPGNASELMATYMYKTAFNATRFGYGSAMAVFIFIVSMVAVGLTRLIQIKLIHEE